MKVGWISRKRREAAYRGALSLGNRRLYDDVQPATAGAAVAGTTGQGPALDCNLACPLSGAEAIKTSRGVVPVAQLRARLRNLLKRISRLQRRGVPFDGDAFGDLLSRCRF